MVSVVCIHNEPLLRFEIYLGLIEGRILVYFIS